MRYVYDNDLHIHSRLSACSNDPAQTPERILEYARTNGLKTICLTDHFWDSAVEGASEWYRPQDFAHISVSRPLPQAKGIRFLFGCETEMDKYMNLGISRERFDEFDFVLIPTTHFHMVGFTIAEEDNTPERKAKLWIEKLDALFDKDLPFRKIGIAHLACCLIESTSRAANARVLDLIDEQEMERVFRRAAALGCGIEINADDMIFEDGERESVLRIFRTAKRCGCKFYLGSDAHHPVWLDQAKDLFENAIDLLELTEDDKFVIGE